MNSNQVLLLQEYLQHMEQAADYLAFSYDRSQEIIHQTSWTLERLESLTNRFARLSDLLTQKIMQTRAKYLNRYFLAKQLINCLANLPLLCG